MQIKARTRKGSWLNYNQTSPQTSDRTLYRQEILRVAKSDIQIQDPVRKVKHTEAHESRYGARRSFGALSCRRVGESSASRSALSIVDKRINVSRFSAA